MTVAIRLACPAPGAYDYPLLIKQLLHTPLATAPTQEIVYRDHVRYTYREFRERLGRLGSALTKFGDHGRGDGLGQPPLPRMLFCNSDAERSHTDGERPLVTAADPVYSERLPRRGDPGQPGFHSAARGHPPAPGPAESRRPHGRRTRAACAA